MDDFKVIVYSAESNIKDEIYYLNDLLANGLVQLHVRKPSTPKYVLENLILNIDPRKHQNLIIHSHYDLLAKYDLKGIHFTKKYLEKAHPLNVETLINTSRVKSFSLSKPVHCLKELGEVEDHYEFVTLSPIFDSISKVGYGGKKDELANFRSFKREDLKVYALGGITKDNIASAKEMGFDGAVLLGTVWHSDDPVRRYKEVLNTIESIG